MKINPNRFGKYCVWHVGPEDKTINAKQARAAAKTCAASPVWFASCRANQRYLYYELNCNMWRLLRCEQQISLVLNSSERWDRGDQRVLRLCSLKLSDHTLFKLFSQSETRCLEAPPFFSPQTLKLIVERNRLQRVIFIPS